MCFRSTNRKYTGMVWNSLDKNVIWWEIWFSICIPHCIPLLVHSKPCGTIPYPLTAQHDDVPLTATASPTPASLPGPKCKLHHWHRESRSKQGLSVGQGCQFAFAFANLRNEPSGFIKCGEFLDWLKIHSLLKDCPPCLHMMIIIIVAVIYRRLTAHTTPSPADCAIFKSVG